MVLCSGTRSGPRTGSIDQEHDATPCEEDGDEEV